MQAIDAFAAQFSSWTKKADHHKTLIQMIRDYDYPIEKHVYETKDGYYNTVHRISGPRGTIASVNNKTPHKRPVILY